MFPANTEHRSATPKLAQKIRKSLVGAALCAGALLGGGAFAQLPQAQHSGSIEYVTGGIGIDESTAFKQAMSRYPLALTFAQRLDGKAAYVSDVSVVIRNAKNDNILNADANGPYFLVRLPAGKYRVSATYQNKTQTRNVDVHAKGSARAVFEWH